MDQYLRQVYQGAGERLQANPGLGPRDWLGHPRLLAHGEAVARLIRQNVLYSRAPLVPLDLAVDPLPLSFPREYKLLAPGHSPSADLRVPVGLL